MGNKKLAQKRASKKVKTVKKPAGAKKPPTGAGASQQGRRTTAGLSTRSSKRLAGELIQDGENSEPMQVDSNILENSPTPLPETRDPIPQFTVSGSDVNEIARLLVGLQQTASPHISAEETLSTAPGHDDAMEVDSVIAIDVDPQATKDTLASEAAQPSKQARKIGTVADSSTADHLTSTTHRPKAKQPSKASNANHGNKGRSNRASRQEREDEAGHLSSASSDSEGEEERGYESDKSSETITEDEETDEEVIPMQFQVPTADGSTKTVSFMSNTTFDHFIEGVGSFLKCPKDKVAVSFKFNGSRKTPMCLDTQNDWKRLRDDYRSAVENAERAYSKARKKWKEEGKTQSRPKKKTIEIVIVSRVVLTKDKSKGSGTKGKKGSQKGEVHRDGHEGTAARGSDRSDKSDSDIEPSGDAKSTRGRWILKIRSQKEWKCELHPGTVCFQRSDGYHYQLTTQDLNYWAGLIDKGLGQVNSIPEELHIHEKSNNRPINKRTTKEPESAPALATIEASTNALAQAVQLVTMTFGAGRGLAPPPVGGEGTGTARQVASNTGSVDAESISSPALRRHVREQVIYPAIEPWLARLEAKDPDNHPWTQYGTKLSEKKYLRINQLADTRMMSSDKLMRLVPGLEEGSADYLISTAIDECAELQANARKALMRERT
ncbi:hypothetical protein FRC01_000658 [Tulasnella sp. 417]|nr:hypothetical protein FRC01_000658 [Tulasnella sp. 417]